MANPLLKKVLGETMTNPAGTPPAASAQTGAASHLTLNPVTPEEMEELTQAVGHDLAAYARRDALYVIRNGTHVVGVLIPYEGGCYFAPGRGTVVQPGEIQ
jgi:hypothetical protein